MTEPRATCCRFCDARQYGDHTYQQPLQGFQDVRRAGTGTQRDYETSWGLPWDLQRVHQSATKKRFSTPWKSTGIAVAGALGLAIAIGLLVYFLAYDQRPFYYNGNFKVTDVRYSDDLARKSSGAFREQSRRVERLQFNKSPAGVSKTVNMPAQGSLSSLSPFDPTRSMMHPYPFPQKQYLL